MSKQTPKALRTRQYIIEKTASLFNTKGYAGTSMSDLTAATGLTKGSIYGNFENKESVAVEAFKHNLQQVEAAIQRHVAAASDSRTKLLAYAKAYRDFSAGDFPPGGCPVLNTATEADDTVPKLRQLAAVAVARWQERLEFLIDTGKKAGEFRADCDAAQTALSIIALIEGGVMLCKLNNRQQQLDQVLLTVEFLIDNLRKD